MADDFWIERAQSAEAKLATAIGQIEPLKEKVRTIRENLCAKERADGSYTIDFVALADRLGIEGALELRKEIDKRYHITGASGEKPRVKIAAVG